MGSAVIKMTGNLELNLSADFISTFDAYHQNTDPQRDPGHVA
jgi:hypothetical protein